MSDLKNKQKEDEEKRNTVMRVLFGDVEKELAKKQRGFCIVLEVLFNHEDHEGHESNKKLAGGGKPHPYDYQ